MSMTTTTTPSRPEVLADQIREVMLAQIREVDPTLLEEITTARRELELLVPRILPLLAKVVPLDERVIDVAEILEPGAFESRDSRMIGDVQRATGADELWRVFLRLAAAFPAGTGGLIDG